MRQIRVLEKLSPVVAVWEHDGAAPGTSGHNQEILRQGILKATP